MCASRWHPKRQGGSLPPRPSSDSAAFAPASTTSLAGERRAAGITCASVVGVELHMCILTPRQLSHCQRAALSVCFRNAGRSAGPRDAKSAAGRLSEPRARAIVRLLRLGVTGQSLDSDLALLRVVGGPAAVLLRGADEYVARAALRPAQRGQGLSAVALGADDATEPVRAPRSAQRRGVAGAVDITRGTRRAGLGGARRRLPVQAVTASAWPLWRWGRSALEVPVATARLLPEPRATDRAA